MSGATSFTFDEGDEIPLHEWLEFCREHGIEYRAGSAGRNLFRSGDIEITFGLPDYGEPPRLPDGRPDLDRARAPDFASRVTVSTRYGGNLEGVARLAARIWLRWGGTPAPAPEPRHR